MKESEKIKGNFRMEEKNENKRREDEKRKRRKGINTKKAGRLQREAGHEIEGRTIFKFEKKSQNRREDEEFMRKKRRISY